MHLLIITEVIGLDVLGGFDFPHGKDNCRKFDYFGSCDYVAVRAGNLDRFQGLSHFFCSQYNGYKIFNFCFFTSLRWLR